MRKNKATKYRAAETKELAMHYMQTLVDVARESFLILDSNIRVISANGIFYKNFKVLPEHTEHKLLYKLGNGQWNIPQLKTLLEEILPNKKVVKDYEVTHKFEKIGKRTMILNARQIDNVNLIILAIEDISDKKLLEDKLAQNVQDLEKNVEKRSAELTAKFKELESVNKTMVDRELKMVELKKEIEILKKKVKKGNKNHKNGL